MRRSYNFMPLGCLFFCLGGGIYSTPVNGAAPASTAAPQADPILQQAIQAANALTAGAVAPASGAAPAAPLGIAAATQPAPVAPGTDLAAPVVNIGPDGTVEAFSVQDMDINAALHTLSLLTKRNIIISKDVKGPVTVNLYNVTFYEALDAFLTPNGYGYLEKGNFIYVYPAKDIEDIHKRDRKAVNRVFHLKYMNAADAAVLIKPVLSSSGQIALTPPALTGITMGSSDTGGTGYATDDTLVVNDFAENLSDVEKTLLQLDVRPKQVLIEATILRATLQEDNALGIDLVSLSGMNFGGITGGGITNNVMNSFQTGAVPATPAKAVVGTDFASQVPQGGLSVGFLSNNINVFLRALEQTTDTTVVANPKILALNKHRGEVFIGQQFGYLTTTTTQTTTQQTVQFLDTGTQLIFRPFITDDGYVRMEIHPEDSAGGLSSGLPQKQSTEVTSNLMIKDGRTVIIGGLFREQTTASKGQVPVIGNIPVLGIPFRRTADNTQRTETIVLITPHIINDDTALYEESQKRQQDVTRMMLGNRAGLQPWGRDRLAQTWYSSAQASLAKGDREKALMYTDWALNTNPNFIEAIKMREELTHKKVVEADESSLRGFVRDVIREDHATIPNTGRSGHYPPEPTATEPTTAPAGVSAIVPANVPAHAATTAPAAHP